MSKLNSKVSTATLKMAAVYERSRIVGQIGRAIKYHRNQMGMTQQELSEKMGFNRTYLGAIERGERNISLVTLINLSKNLEVSIVDLVSF
jgi:transcriptional regulator with XRE-family HTH domain